jgi:hypothetical protein
MSCLQDRRTRRVAQGVSLKAGDMSYESANPPSPLTPLEEAILIASTSVTGAVMHDGPTQKPDGSAELGTMFLEVAGRAASSADNAQATSFFMINDEGVWLIKRPRGREAIELIARSRRAGRTAPRDDWLAFANAVKRKVYDQRFQFPREWPLLPGLERPAPNARARRASCPSSTTRASTSTSCSSCSSRWARRRCSWTTGAPSAPSSPTGSRGPSKVGAVDPIPYQPIGGIRRVRGGFVSPDVPAPLGSLTEVRTDYEAHFLMQNLMLTGEALRLGGWVHGAPMIPHVWKRDTATGHLGLGFREYSAKPSTSRFKRWPPVPASQPNYVGIDGVLEGLCPPYVTDMDAAVDQVLEEKFGPGGTYADAKVFAQAYKDEATAEPTCERRHPRARRSSTRRRSAATSWRPTGASPPTPTPSPAGHWVVLHLELEYYERFGNPAHAPPAEGKEIWNRE